MKFVKKTIAVCALLIFYSAITLAEEESMPDICSMNEVQLEQAMTVDNKQPFTNQVEAHSAIFYGLSKTLNKIEEHKKDSDTKTKFQQYASCETDIGWYLQPYIKTIQYSKQKIDEGYKFSPDSISNGPPASGQLVGPGQEPVDVDPKVAFIMAMLRAVAKCANEKNCPDPNDQKELESNNVLVNWSRQNYAMDASWWAGALIVGDDNGVIAKMLTDPAGSLEKGRDEVLEVFDKNGSGEITELVKDPVNKAKKTVRELDREIRKIL